MQQLLHRLICFCRGFKCLLREQQFLGASMKHTVRLEPGRKIRPFILDVSEVICEQFRNLYVFPEGDEWLPIFQSSVHSSWAAWNNPCALHPEKFAICKTFCHFPLQKHLNLVMVHSSASLGACSSKVQLCFECKFTANSTAWHSSGWRMTFICSLGQNLYALNLRVKEPRWDAWGCSSTGRFPSSFQCGFCRDRGGSGSPLAVCGPVAACSSHLVLPCWEAVTQLNDSPVV